MPYIPATADEIARLLEARGERVGLEIASLFVRPRPKVGQFEFHFGRSCMQRKVSNVTSAGIVSNGDLTPFCSTTSRQLEGRAVFNCDAIILVHQGGWPWVEDIFHKGTDPSQILQEHSEQILFQRALKHVALRLSGKEPRVKMAEALLPAELWGELSRLRLIYYDSSVAGYDESERNRPAPVLRGLAHLEVDPTLVRVTFKPCSDSTCPVCECKEGTTAWLDEMVNTGRWAEIPEAVLVSFGDGGGYFVYHGNMRALHAIQRSYPLRAAVIASQEDFSCYLRNNEPAWFGVRELTKLLRYMRIFAAHPAVNKHSTRGLPPDLREEVAAIYYDRQTEAMNQAFGWDEDD